MQTIQNHFHKAAFNEYVAQVQGFLTSQFGVVANARGLALVAEYYAKRTLPLLLRLGAGPSRQAGRPVMTCGGPG